VHAIDTLDERITTHGIALSRDKLVSLGRERFKELLKKDRTTRELQRVVRSHTDFSSWPSIEYAFASANALVTQVPKRRNADILADTGTDRDEAARISGFHDLWKVA
jgi:hypothetical protein